LNQSGNVLIPIDTAGRVLEVALMLDQVLFLIIFTFHCLWGEKTILNLIHLF